MREMMPFRGRMRPRREREGLLDFFDEMFAPDFWNQGMRTDIQETEDAYWMEIELPGYKKEDLNLELKNNMLKITAQKDEEEEEKKQNYIHRERRRGTIQRCFTIDENVDQDQVEAQFENGILKLKLPKKQKGTGEGRTIDID